MYLNEILLELCVILEKSHCISIGLFLFSMNSEVLQLKEERDRQARELSDMSEVGKRRDQELIRIEEELKTMSEELQKANAAKVSCVRQFLCLRI